MVNRVFAILAATALALTTLAAGGTEAEAAHGLRLIGHDPLFNRGMNAAPAIYKHHMYVGNRTDGSEGHSHPGILVLNIANPTRPRVVNEIGPPHAGVIGQTTRELRVWPRAGLLMVMSFRCSSFIHDCAAGQPDEFTIKFFDVAADPVNPPLVSTYQPSFRPHEMYLWLDPKRRGRALLYLSTPSGSLDPERPNLVVTDISRARQDEFTEIAAGNGNHLFPEDVIAAGNLALHSMGVSADGRRTYLAHLAGGFLVVDSSDVARAVSNPELRLLTDPEDRVTWFNPEAHSAVEVPGRRLAVTTDEVYGTLVGDDHGCPWGWMRVMDVSDPAKPRQLGEFKTPENEESFCDTPIGRDDERVSFASHNPTLLKHLALVTWHSSGFQVVDISRPTRPRKVAEHRPRPLPNVATEDPALSAGPGKVVMWSYPIIKNGLIYVVDIRNGLYVYAYNGPHAGSVRTTRFLEGNSNL